MTLLDHRTAKTNVFPWPLFVALAIVLLCLTPAPSTNPFDGPMIVAQRMLHGDADLRAGLTWMEAFNFQGRRYLAYPPMVTFILVPYAALGGGALGQTAANSLLIFGSALLLHALLRRTPGLERHAAIGAAVWVLATPLLYSAHVGNVWLLMHSEGNFFLLLALYLVAVRRSFFWAGLAFMVASLTRHAILFSAPAFAVLAFQQRRGTEEDLRAVVRDLLRFALGASIPAALVLTYNWWIFDDPLKNPYVAAWRQKSGGWLRANKSIARTTFGSSSFALESVWRNATFYLTARPVFVPWFPYVRFTGAGESIWLLSPFFLGVFAANLRIALVRALLAGAIPMLFFYLLYSYQGYVQYGSRYLSDLFPFLVPIALSALARPSTRWRPLLLALVAVSIAFNAYGTWIVSTCGLGPPKVWRKPVKKPPRAIDRQHPRPTTARTAHADRRMASPRDLR